jgi:hypothetical protein
MHLFFWLVFGGIGEQGTLFVLAMNQFILLKWSLKLLNLLHSLFLAFLLGFLLILLVDGFPGIHAKLTVLC